MTKRRKVALAVGSAALVAGVVAGGALELGAAESTGHEAIRGGEAAQPKIEPRADALLRRMSDFMGRQQRFAVRTEGDVEVVLEDGQKLGFPFESEVKVQRPNKLRADRRGARTDLQFFYDGREFALYGKNQHAYARAPAPPTLDAAIDQARNELGLEAPGADVIYTNAYKGMMEDVESGRYVGQETLHGEVCDHLAFRGKETDFQIWVHAGGAPTPCRYVVTTKTMSSKPEFRVDFREWELTPRFAADEFSFTPPAGAQRIEFLTATKMRRQAEERMRKQGGEK